MNQSDVRLGSHTTLYTGVQKIFHFLEICEICILFLILWDYNLTRSSMDEYIINRA